MQVLTYLFIASVALLWQPAQAREASIDAQPLAAQEGKQVLLPHSLLQKKQVKRSKKGRSSSRSARHALARRSKAAAHKSSALQQKDSVKARRSHKTARWGHSLMQRKQTKRAARVSHRLAQRLRSRMAKKSRKGKHASARKQKHASNKKGKHAKKAHKARHSLLQKDRVKKKIPAVEEEEEELASPVREERKASKPATKLKLSHSLMQKKQVKRSARVSHRLSKRLRSKKASRASKVHGQKIRAKKARTYIHSHSHTHKVQKPSHSLLQKKQVTRKKRASHRQSRHQTSKARVSHRLSRRQMQSRATRKSNLAKHLRESSHQSLKFSQKYRHALKRHHKASHHLTPLPLVVGDQPRVMVGLERSRKPSHALRRHPRASHHLRSSKKVGHSLLQRKQVKRKARVTHRLSRQQKQKARVGHRLSRQQMQSRATRKSNLAKHLRESSHQSLKPSQKYMHALKRHHKASHHLTPLPLVVGDRPRVMVGVERSRQPSLALRRHHKAGHHLRTSSWLWRKDRGARRTRDRHDLAVAKRGLAAAQAHKKQHSLMQRKQVLKQGLVSDADVHAQSETSLCFLGCGWDGSVVMDSMVRDEL